MTTREPNEIRELTEVQLDLITGGSIAHDVNTAVKLVGAAAGLVWWSMKVGVNPPYDPWG